MILVPTINLYRWKKTILSVENYTGRRPEESADES